MLDLIPGKFQVKALYFQFVFFIHIQYLIQFLVIAEENPFGADSFPQINFTVYQASFCFYIIIEGNREDMDVGGEFQIFQIEFEVLAPIQFMGEEQPVFSDDIHAVKFIPGSP